MVEDAVCSEEANVSGVVVIGDVIDVYKEHEWSEVVRFLWCTRRPDPPVCCLLPETKALTPSSVSPPTP